MRSRSIQEVRNKKDSIIKGKSHCEHCFYMRFTRVNSCRIHIEVFQDAIFVFRGGFGKLDFGGKNVVYK